MTQTVKTPFERAQASGVQAPDPPLPDVRAPIVGFDATTSEHSVALLERFRAIVSPRYLDIIDAAWGTQIIPDQTMNPAISAHGVGFGWLVTPGSEARAIALKPFSRADDAIREMRGYLRLEQLGIQTFTPLAVFPAQDRMRGFVVMTERRDDLVSFDRDQWVERARIDSAVSAEIAERNELTIKAIAACMAYIHAHGIFHPDGQIKNWAVTPEGRIGIIDTESLVQIDPADNRVSEFAWQDMEKLVRSLIAQHTDGQDESILGVGMMHGLSLREARATIYDVLIQPYLEALVEQIPNDNPMYAQAIQDLYDAIAERFVSDEGWPGHFIANGKH